MGKPIEVGILGKVCGDVRHPRWGRKRTSWRSGDCQPTAVVVKLLVCCCRWCGYAGSLPARNADPPARRRIHRNYRPAPACCSLAPPIFVPPDLFSPVLRCPAPASLHKPPSTPSSPRLISPPTRLPLPAHNRAQPHCSPPSLYLPTFVSFPFL